MITPSLNNKVFSKLKVSLNIITVVKSKTINEILCINIELFFLKTPKINKNIIDRERKISGITNSKFVKVNYLLS